MKLVNFLLHTIIYFGALHQCDAGSIDFNITFHFKGYHANRYGGVPYEKMDIPPSFFSGGFKPGKTERYYTLQLAVRLYRSPKYHILWTIINVSMRDLYYGLNPKKVEEFLAYSSPSPDLLFVRNRDKALIRVKLFAQSGKITINEGTERKRIVTRMSSDLIVCPVPPCSNYYSIRRSHSFTFKAKREDTSVRSVNFRQYVFDDYEKLTDEHPYVSGYASPFHENYQKF